MSQVDQQTVLYSIANRTRLVYTHLHNIEMLLRDKMYTASSLDTERQYDHCKKPWEEESDQAVDSLLQALLTNKNNFADLFTQAANIRMKVAAKLNHDDGGFGEFQWLCH